MNFKTYWPVRLAVFLAVVGGLVIIPVHQVLAQDPDAVELTTADEEAFDSEVVLEADDMAADELAGDIMIAFGTLTAITEGQLTLLEYDFDTDQDVEAVYAIDEDTEYENVADASQLVVDDPVEIIYMEMEGARIALVVTKEKLDIEDDSLSEVDPMDMEEPLEESETMPEEITDPAELP